MRELPLDAIVLEPFLAAVINEHHAAVRAAGQRSSGHFQYLTQDTMSLEFPRLAERWRGGKALFCYLTPMNHWRPVTVYPWRKVTPATHAKQILRAKIAPYMPRRDGSQSCAVSGCGERWGLECDHLTPTFDEIAEECIKLITPDELASSWRRRQYSFEDIDPVDSIPNSHPAIQRLFELHGSAQLQWLCPEHHRERHRKAVILPPNQILRKSSLEP